MSTRTSTGCENRDGTLGEKSAFMTCCHNLFFCSLLAAVPKVAAPGCVVEPAHGPGGGRGGRGLALAPLELLQLGLVVPELAVIPLAAAAKEELAETIGHHTTKGRSESLWPRSSPRRGGWWRPGRCRGGRWRQRRVRR